MFGLLVCVVSWFWAFYGLAAATCTLSAIACMLYYGLGYYGLRTSGLMAWLAMLAIAATAVRWILPACVVFLTSFLAFCATMLLELSASWLVYFSLQALPAATYWAVEGFAILCITSGARLLMSLTIDELGKVAVLCTPLVLPGLPPICRRVACRAAFLLACRAAWLWIECGGRWTIPFLRGGKQSSRDQLQALVAARRGGDNQEVRASIVRPLVRGGHVGVATSRLSARCARGRRVQRNSQTDKGKAKAKAKAKAKQGGAGARDSGQASSSQAGSRTSTPPDDTAATLTRVRLAPPSFRMRGETLLPSRG